MYLFVPYALVEQKSHLIGCVFAHTPSLLLVYTFWGHRSKTFAWFLLAQAFIIWYNRNDLASYFCVSWSWCLRGHRFRSGTIWEWWLLCCFLAVHGHCVLICFVLGGGNCSTLYGVLRLFVRWGFTYNMSRANPYTVYIVSTWEKLKPELPIVMHVSPWVGADRPWAVMMCSDSYDSFWAIWIVIIYDMMMDPQNIQNIRKPSPIFVIPIQASIKKGTLQD